MKNLSLNQMENVEGGAIDHMDAFLCGAAIGIGFALAGPFGAMGGAILGCAGSLS